MEYLSWKFVAPRHRRRCASAARFKCAGPCTGADARHGYRVETATLPRAENEGLDKLSGGNMSLYPCDTATQTLLPDNPVCDQCSISTVILGTGLFLSPELLRDSPKKKRLSRLQKEVASGKHPDREG